MFIELTFPVPGTPPMKRKEMVNLDRIESVVPAGLGAGFTLVGHPHVYIVHESYDTVRDAISNDNWLVMVPPYYSGKDKVRTFAKGE